MEMVISNVNKQFSGRVWSPANELHELHGLEKTTCISMQTFIHMHNVAMWVHYAHISMQNHVMENLRKGMHSNNVVHSTLSNSIGQETSTMSPQPTH